MKRKTLKFFVCAALMAMTLSVTACGGSDKEDKAAETENATGDEVDAADEAADTEEDAADETADTKADAADEAADTEEDAADEADSSADATGSTLEELFNDPTAKAMFDSMTQAMQSDGMSASVSAVENEMIVEVKIEDSSMVTDGIGETLEAAIDAQADTFKTQVKTLDEAVGQAGACTFTVRYFDPDGNVLAEKSFKAE